MEMMVLVAAEPNGFADVPGWALLVTAALTAAGVVGHWRFRTGWGMDRYRERPYAELAVVTTGYMALPGAILFGAATAAFLIARLVGSEPGVVASAAMLCLLLVALVSGIWGMKEFYRPTRRRTPEWLRGSRAEQ